MQPHLLEELQVCRTAFPVHTLVHPYEKRGLRFASDFSVFTFAQCLNAMRVTIHGHRPSCLAASNEATVLPPEPGAPDRRAATEPNRSDEMVTQIHLGFFKLKIHRQPARQAQLLTQLRPASPAAAEGLSSATSQASVIQAAQRAASLSSSSSEEPHEPDDQPVEPQARSDSLLSPCDAGPTSALSHRQKPSSRQEYEEHWNEWALQDESGGTHRTEAVRRMLAWFDAHQAPTPLVLSQLELTSLPEYLPEGLRELNVSSNHLTSLPDHLPSSLEVLDAEANQLLALPDDLPPTLRWLDVTTNRLSSLPSHLPDSLEMLDVANNQLATLPESLPNALIELNASSNALTELPSVLPESLQRLIVRQNQLSALPETLPGSLSYIDVSRNQLIG